MALVGGSQRAKDRGGGVAGGRQAGRMRREDVWDQGDGRSAALPETAKTGEEAAETNGRRQERPRRRRWRPK